MREVADPSTLNKGAPLRGWTRALCLALLLALGGCAAPDRSIKPDSSTRPVGWSDAQGALDAFTRAWNARDADALILAFSPARRPLAAAHRAALLRRMAAARVLGASLDHRCHGRGDALLIGRLRLGPRHDWTPDAPAASWAEAMWLIQTDDGRWWVFSL